MKRLASLRSWRRVGAQVGLLAGLGLAFAGGVETRTVDAAPDPCELEGDCSFKKPLLAFVLDASSSMNEPFAGDTTRWQAATAAIAQAIEFDNGYLAEHFILGLIRFGHDPDPDAPGTTIAGDTSGLVDGQRLDVPWYDPAEPAKAYTECSNGDAIVAALAAAGPPARGIGSWTRGALEFAAASITTSAADHPQDLGTRPAVLVLVTDGAWTDPQGTTPLAPASADPKLTAGPLWTQQGVPTYVVALGDAAGQVFADELAIAGGTTAAIDGADPQGLLAALTAVIADVQQDVVEPQCLPGFPRLMVLLDASSSMLNIDNGTQHAPPGQGGWDLARDALAGFGGLFDVVVGDELKIDNLVHLGLAVFGHDQPAEQKLLVQYGPCQKANFAWALDPESSCVAPGCVDPYGPPPITWTTVDGSLVDPPDFAAPTLSHMPRCDLNPQNPDACVGSGTYTHLGLELVRQNIIDHQLACAEPTHPYPCDETTKYLNVLITDGKYNSTDAQVQAPLQAMFADGVITHVIGFGDAVDPVQLGKLADWGSGATLGPIKANNQDQLELALAAIVDSLVVDDCCPVADCTPGPQPSSDSDPDPVVPETSSSTGETGTSSETGTTADGDTTAAVDTGTNTGVSTSTSTDVTTSATDASTTTATSTTDPGTGTSTTVTGTTDASTTADPSGPIPTTTAPAPTTTSEDPATASSASEREPGAVDAGCACTHGGPAPGSWTALLVLGLVGARRRRPGPPAPAQQAVITTASPAAAAAP